MRLFVFIFLLLLGSQASGQIDVVNKSISQPEIKRLYRFHANEIQINGIKTDSSFLIMVGRDTLNFFNNKYHYQPYSRNKQDTFRIYDNGKSVYEEIFEIKGLPILKAYYGTIRDTLISKRYLLTNPELVLSYEPEIYITCSRIISFDASIIKRNGQEELLSENLLLKDNLSEKELIKRIKRGYEGGNTFSKKQLRRIKRMKKGETIWFKYATFSCPSCVSTKKFIDIKLTIID
jgi:hypothetical protein